MNLLPQSVKNTLWSYDASQIDIQKDKTIVIFNILNWGSVDAIEWLHKTYSQDEIKNVIKESNSQSWSHKSLHYWSSFFGIEPLHKKRFS